MKIRVRFFAAVREAVGEREREMVLEPGATLRDLREVGAAAAP